MLLAKSRAFTLVELLVAMTIGVIIMGACYTSLRTVLDADEAVGGRCALSQEGRRALDEMAGAMRAALTVGGSGAQFVGEDAERDGLPDDRVTFYTVSDRPARLDEVESDIYEVSFFVVRDEETGEGSLARRKDPGVDDDFNNGGILTQIAMDVVGLDVEYYDGLSWQDEWTPDESTGIPEAMRVSIVLADPASGEQSTVMETTVVVMATGGVSEGDQTSD